VCSIPPCLHLAVHATKGIIILKRAEQLVVARASFVRSGHDRVHDTEPGERADPLRRTSIARPDDTIPGCRMFQGTHHRRADGDHAPAPRAGRFDRSCRRRGDVIRLVERQKAVEIGIARRRDACGVGDGCKPGSARTD
jgi:hypothetical protein